MKGEWAVATEQLHCGAGTGHDVPSGDLVWTMGKIVRCQDHAPAHRQLTDQEADAVRHAQEALAAAAAERNAPRNIRACIGTLRGFHHIADTPAPAHTHQAPERVARVTPPVRPKPFAAVADVPDPKAHAFNR